MMTSHNTSTRAASLPALLKMLWFTPGPRKAWGLPMIFEDIPGSGKTACIEAACASMNLVMSILIGSLREPADIAGLPIPDMDQQRIRRFLEEWAAKLIADPHAVLFLDEIGSVAPAVQAALLRVAAERVVGDTALPRTVRVIAAMNPIAVAANGWDLTPPLANRFGHMKFPKISHLEWSNWLVGFTDDDDAKSTFSAVDEEERVMDLWPEVFAKARGMVAGFVQRRPELLEKCPDEGDPQRSKAWPSRRTWEYTARAIAGVDAHDLDEIDRDRIVEAYVGPGAGAEFVAYAADGADLPEAKAVLDGGAKFEHNAARLDRTAAFLASCSAFLAADKTEDKQRTARGEKLWHIVDSIAKDSADLTVPTAQFLIRSQIKGLTKVSVPVLAKLRPFCQAAGLEM